MKVKAEVLVNNFTMNKVDFYKRGEVISLEEVIVKSFPQLLKKVHDHVEEVIEPAEEVTEVEETELTKEEIKRLLDEKDISYDKKANKQTLLSLLEEVSEEE